MPTNLYRVCSVCSEPTRHPDVTRYSICLEPGEPLVAGTLVTTVNGWAASIAQRAKETNQPVRIGWRETKYGHELVTIELAGREAA